MHRLTRYHIVPIRFSSIELELIHTAILLAGENRSEFIRNAAKAKAEQLLAVYNLSNISHSMRVMP